MTHRERILAAIRGQIPDRMPWVPRLEFWYRGCARQGKLPPELRSLSLMELSDHLGVGCYSTIPDFTDLPEEDAMIDRALGIFHLPVIPYRVTLEDVDRRVLRRGPETVVEYHTPVGSIRTSCVFTEEMLDGGVSISWVTHHAINEPRDFDVVGHIFSHLKVEPNLPGYMAHREKLGERGLAVGYLQGTACPMQHIMKELMTLEQFFYALNDYPEKVQHLAEQIQPYFEQMRRIGLTLPAEVVFLGANYDDSITYPAFFAKHFLPPLREYAGQLHAQGKYLMTHTDGENQKLFPLYLEAGFDVADSVCPYPMTRCTVEQIRAAFQDRITLWGGIPSTLLCATSTPEDEFRRTIDGLVDRYGKQSHFILGVSDMVTSDCEFDRLQYITDAVAGSP